MSSVLGLVASLFFGSAAIAQACAPVWQAGDPVPYAKGDVVSSVVWDPDGAGPAASVLVCGGQFSAGALGDVKVAAHDGTQWLALGTPYGTITNALAVVNGNLVAATVSGSGTSVAVWNGTDWVQFGSANGWVHAMATHNGALVIGGWFGYVSGVAAANVAQFDTNGWSALGSGVNGTVLALASFNGALQVGGSFTNAGGIVVQNHALWNSPQWFSGVWFNGTVDTFAVRTAVATTQTYLFAGGAFTAFGTTSALHVARLTQSTNTWSAVGAGIPGTTCKRLFVRTFGVSSYELTAAVEGNSDEIWRWSGSAWAPLGFFSDDNPAALPRTLAYHGGSYVLGLQAGDRAVRAFDGGSQWPALTGLGIDERVSTSCSVGNEFVIGGSFRTISGVVMNGIARGGPGAWLPMGTGMEGGFGVFDVVTMPNGDIVAAGNFTAAGGVAANNLARWNGTSWAQFGGGVNDTVYALEVLPNGDLVAAGRFTVAGGLARNRIARWNGSTWLALGSGSPSQVNAVHLAPNGDLLVGGNFTTIGGITASRIAKWNGSAWAALGGGPNNAVWCVDTAPNGDVVIGGAFSSTDGIPTAHVAKWNGTAWSAVGSAFAYYPETDVLSLAVLPDGDIVACGEEWSWGFSTPIGSVNISGNVARYDAGNGTWSSMGVHGPWVQHVRALPEGGLVIGGFFEAPSANFARLAPTCPATAVVAGNGCNGATLTPATLPWNESKFRAVGTGLPSTAIVLTVTSVTSVPQGAAPLSLVFGQALPGCDVLVAPDILGVLVTTTGTATSELFVAPSPSLVGVTFFHQMVPIAVDAQGAWTTVTATNSLQLVAGSY